MDVNQKGNESEPHSSKCWPNEIEDRNSFKPNDKIDIEPKKPPLYDQFEEELPEDDESICPFLQKLFAKTFKFFSLVLFASAVLGTGLISKASFMVLINSAKPLASSKNLTELDLIDHDILRVWSFIILLVTMLAPEVMSMTYSLYRIIKKPECDLDLKVLLWGLLWEVLHAIGESILILGAFPHLDTTFALLMMPLIGIVPIICHVCPKYISISQNNDSSTDGVRNTIKFCLSVTALVLQLGGFVTLFSGFFFNHGTCDAKATCTSESYWFCFLCPNYTYIWAFAGIFLSSMRYWENFVSTTSNYHYKLDKVRFQTSFVYSFVKCLIVTGMTFLVVVVLENNTYVSASVLQNTTSYTQERYANILQLFQLNDGKPNVRNQILKELWYVFAVQFCASLMTFYMGYLACVTMIQIVSFTIPLMLITPTLSAISAAVGVYKNNGLKKDLWSFFGLSSLNKTQNLQYYIDWNNVISFNTDKGATDPVVTPSSAAVAVIVGLLAGYFGIVLISDYLWKNPSVRLERMETLFVKPLFGVPFIDQVMLLNRRQYENEYLKSKQETNRIKNQRSSETVESNGSARNKHLSDNRKTNTQLFLCATMWHETEKEMTQLLTSIMRLDRDQGNRIDDSNDYYKFETHILFDDAMERRKDQNHRQLNEFVHRLCKLIPEAAKRVQASRDCNLSPPIFYPTPYGGRLLFEMPHKNKLIVHLKDKEKIRHRKRWSQCMYMYYILGYLQATKKAYRLEDIFLLALDGDVDFQPSAVLLLLDRMKRNPDVGAACGRIHPIGSGPVVWFQKFEYAVGHWFQKTAEHVLGCVLCSPGCFSLFRGSALNKILKSYATKATEALHYVQWDQGEDRWLCTLLLKQGSKIEYCAASDSYTFAPEDFKEIFNQRKRWGPSSMANNICILRDAKLAVKKNDYISWVYMAYQFGLMVSSLLGPAMVILVIQGSIEYVFKWNASLCLFLSMAPVIIFIILCYTINADTQITVAAVLGSIFALIMMAVLVDLIGNLATHSVLDPINSFMIALVALYAFTGILHPQEIMWLVHGLLYFLCIPTAFVFLTVYSLTNLNNVSWGTRETKKTNEDERPEENKQLKRVLPFLNLKSTPRLTKKKEKKNKETGKSFLDASLTFDPQLSSDCCCSYGLGSFCQCNLCCRTIPKPMMVDGDHNVTEKTQNIIETAPSTSSISSQQTTETNNVNPQADEMLGEDEKDLYEVLRGIFKDAKKEQLDGEEREFWEYMIEHYLHPLEENQEEKEKIKSDLKALRNRMTVAYFLLNGLWVFFNFAVQLKITDISFHFTINGTLIKANPVSLLFVLFFLLILIIQFGCMLVHRWLTTLHYLAVTSLRWNDGRDDIKKVKNNDEVEEREGTKEVDKAIAEKGNGDNRASEVSDREMNHSNGSDNSGFIKDSDSKEIETAEAIDRIEEEQHLDTKRNELKSKTEKKKEEILSKSGSNVVVVKVHTHESTL